MPDFESRPRTFFPSQINTYRQCPRRYYLQYILKRKRTMPFSAALVKGGATHRLIARTLPHFIRTGALPSDLRARARDEVESGNYPENERRQLERDSFEVAKWTVGALEMMPPGSSTVLQERNLYAPVGKHGIQLGARVDLVLRHEDGTIEHIDFKTGRVRPNPIQDLISRIVVGNRERQAPRIRTTTLNVQHRHSNSSVLDREICAAEWQGIAGTIKAIRSSDDWEFQPGPLCDYCQFKARDCPAW